MKSFAALMIGATLLWPDPANASPFLGCESALNYGSNMARFYIGTLYKKAGCNRARATQYEEFFFVIVPTYWAEEAATATPEEAACLLQGAFSGSMDTIRKEHADCGAVAGFGTIRRGLLGLAAGALLNAFYWNAADYYSDEIVKRVFAYDFGAWPLDGSVEECNAALDREASGVPKEILEVFKSLVCAI